MSERLKTYRQFWPYYLREHSRPVTRALHYVGSTLAILLVIALVITANFWLLAGAVFSGYLFAWIGHFGFEKNRPATFTYPLWSLFSDFRMYFLWLAGRLEAELEKAGVANGNHDETSPAT